MRENLHPSGPVPANVERFSGFADEYDSFRPRPPSALAELLPSLAGCATPELVVDIGSGTGLSTRFWSERAERVVGIEPNGDMRARAVAVTGTTNVEYRAGTSDSTGLADRCADIVTCSQALHWLPPESTFSEVARILRPGGVFAAFDYDWPPATGSWKADAAFEACLARSGQLEREAGLPGAPTKWAKEEHLSRMIASGRFRHTREIVLHHLEKGNADRFVGLLLSQGQVVAMLKAGYGEAELGVDEFRRICREELGTQERTWYWGSRVRLGIV